MGPKGAVASSAVLVLLAAQVRAQPVAQPQERIEVTGTQIKRTDTETVAPVDIITREQIERSGRATVAEVLRNIPANTGGSFDETFWNGFAPGGAGVSLRGLGQRATLVLLNGRRIAGYAWAQNLQDVFVDLNAIPVSAVERIEVLKDGASAIYGSDAIGGVVNVVLRRQFDGVEVAGSAGYAEGKRDYRLAATTGVGNLAADGWALVGTSDFYKREALTIADTKLGARRDRRGEPGGRNYRYNTQGGTWRQFTPAGAPTNNYRAISECPGRTLSSADLVDLGIVDPASPMASVPASTFCVLDSGDRLVVFPATERAGLLGRLSYALSPSATAYVDFGFQRVETVQKAGSPNFAATGVLEETAAGPRRSLFNVSFAPGVAGNPFESIARYVGVMHDLGRRDQHIVSDNLRVLAAIEYRLDAWDLESTIGWSRNEVDLDSANFMSRSGVAAVFGIPAGRQPPVPISTASSYDIDRFSLNDDSARAQLLADDAHRPARSQVYFVDTRASTRFGQLSGGPVGIAVGAEFRRESLRDQLQFDQDYLGRTSTTETDGSRRVAATFAEAALPFSPAVEAQVAARYDWYSDYGGSFTPKVGFKWKPAAWGLLRATWGRGFRAPNLVEISPSTSTFFTTVDAPNRISVFGVHEGNPNLEPEESEGATLGLVFQPLADFSVALDLYRTRWENLIVGNCCQDQIDAGDPDRVIRDPDTGMILGVIGSWVNTDRVTVRGADLEATYRIRGPWGRIAASVGIAYVDSWKEGGVEYAGTNGHSVSSIPRLKSNASLDWDWRSFSTTLRWNYVRGVKQRIADASFFTEQDPRFQTGILPARMRSHATWDLYASWKITPQLKFSASVVNVFDRLPPHDPQWGIYDISQFDLRGVRYRAGVTWTM